MTGETTPASRHVLIAGGGIAGLSAGILIAKRGLSVTLFERAPTFEAVGAGIQLSPNATRVLAACEALNSLRAASTSPESIDLRDITDGRLLLSVPVNNGATSRNAPYLVAHRADLQTALLSAARQLPNLRIVNGAELGDVAVHRQGVTVSFSLTEGIEEFRGAVLIGADGAWSTARELIVAEPVRPSGQTAWRMTIPARGDSGAALADITGGTRSVCSFTGPGVHVVCYATQSGRSLNLVCITKDRNGEPTPPSDMAETAQGSIRALLRGTGWVAWPLVETAVDGRWHDGKAILLVGDAAHAMSPHAAQAGAMALEDAAVLARLLPERIGDIPALLTAYDNERRSRVRRVMRRGRANLLAMQATGVLRTGRDLLFRLRPGTSFARDLEWLYGHDATSEPLR
jgi:salicylate hydroxylase